MKKKKVYKIHLQGIKYICWEKGSNFGTIWVLLVLVERRHEQNHPPVEHHNYLLSLIH